MDSRHDRVLEKKDGDDSEGRRLQKQQQNQLKAEVPATNAVLYMQSLNAKRERILAPVNTAAIRQQLERGI